MSSDVDSPIPVTMPRLSDQMEEAMIVQWLHDSGDTVIKGDEIVEIETDKASVNYEAEYSGVLEVLAQPGESVALNAQIAVIHPSGTELSSARGVADTRIEGVASRERRPIEATAVANSAMPARDSSIAVPMRGGARPFASPLVRKRAREMGLNLNGILGSGPRGRIVRKDLDEFVVAQSQTVGSSIDDNRNCEPMLEPQQPAGRALPTTTLTPRQRLIAERMVEAKRSAPEFTVSIDIDMTELGRWRTRLKELEATPPSYNDFMVKAVASAVRSHPRLNSTFSDDIITVAEKVNVGIAVSHEGDLLVPVIDDVGSLSLSDIASASRKLIAAVESASITPGQMTGGTITISNLGMFGVKSFQAILNARQAAIIAFGAIEQRVVPWGDDIRIRDMATVTVTADHRVIYGAEVADFLSELRRLLEEPALLFL